MNARPSSPFDSAFLSDDEEATELVLVRHGQQVVGDFGGPIGASRDAPLSVVGREQARLVGERFAKERVDVVYASNLQRAYDTAAAIASHHALTPIVDPDLREIELFNEMDPTHTVLDAVGQQKLLGIRHRFARDKTWDVYPLSESSAQFRKRVVNTIEGIVADHDGQRIVIGCHGGVIATYLAWTLGIETDMWFRPAHSSVHVLRAKGQVRALQSTNDVHHLRTTRPELVTH